MIVRLSGGLGNQLFQYAFGMAQSIQRKEPLLLDDFSFQRDPLREYALESYQIGAKKLSSMQKIACNLVYYANRKLHFIPKGKAKFGFYYETDSFLLEKVADTKARYFDGCWQNEAYFAQLKPVLQKEFSYQSKLDTEKENFLEKIKKTTSVAVHVRHGDYLTTFNQTIYEIPSNTYYRQAMQYMKEKYPDCVFYFFSDDTAWCRQEFKEEKDCEFAEFTTPSTAQEDIHLMRQCDHYIIANSTFSWWAAFLGSKEESVRIAPKNWYKDPEKNTAAKKALLKEYLLI